MAADRADDDVETGEDDEDFDEDEFDDEDEEEDFDEDEFEDEDDDLDDEDDDLDEDDDEDFDGADGLDAEDDTGARNGDARTGGAGSEYEPGDVNTVASGYEPGDVNTVSARPSEPQRGGQQPGGSDMPVEVLTYLARAMADEPDAVVVQRESRRGSTVLRLHVAPQDMGRVIGRRGRTAQAIRTLVGVAGARGGVQTLVDIADD